MKLDIKAIALFLSFLILGITDIAHADKAKNARSVDSVSQKFGPFPHKRTDTPLLKNATVGRYLYLGNIPQFDAKDLEIYNSKMGLTTRVKAWVSKDLEKTYALKLLARWKKIHDSFQDEKLTFVKMNSLENFEKKVKDPNVKAWLKVAAQYSKHVLEGHGLDIYDQSQSDVEYKKTILTALLREYILSDKAEIVDGLALLDEIQSDTTQLEILSKKLFKSQLDELFTPDASREGYVGFLTVVFPIAAVAPHPEDKIEGGPFSIPNEGFYEVGLSESIEARWWSNKWKDEFGGMPFILLTWDGVAFHGPISNYAPLDIWYLRRGFVSHGCHRMDSSDVYELRSILPPDLLELEKKKKTIPLYEMSWPDVVDLKNNGKPQALDIEYYDIPAGIYKANKSTDIEKAAAPWMGYKAKERWRKQHYSKYDGDKNGGGFSVYDPVSETFKNIPKYVHKKGSLARDGVYENVPVTTMKYRGNRVIQYREKDQPLYIFDDKAGKYPPTFFYK